MSGHPLHLSLDQLQRLAEDAIKNREALESAADEATRPAARMAGRAREAAQHEALLWKRLEIAKALKQVLTERAERIFADHSPKGAEADGG